MVQNQEGVGSVRAAISLFGERMHGAKHRTSSPPTEDSLVRGAHIVSVNESRESLVKVKARKESEQNQAMSAARVVFERIEDSKARAKRKDGGTKDGNYSDLTRELLLARDELDRLKADMGAALEAKSEAEKSIEIYGARAKYYASFANELRKKADEANEEHVLVELARIEAVRELKEVEAQRGTDAARFSNHMKLAKSKIKVLRVEFARAKELESKLEATNLDVKVLQDQMELVRAMERTTLKNPPVKNVDRLRESEIEYELKAAQEELLRVKNDSFQFMASMDLVREEMKSIAEEINKLKVLQKEADSRVQILDSRLLKVRVRLESALNAKSITSNLASDFRRIQSESDSANKEKIAVLREAEALAVELVTSESNTKAAEERLLSAARELEAVRESEAIAIEKLNHVIERTVKARASTSPNSSNSITISELEHDYLTRGAAEAREVAGTKLAASRAWIEALRASEEELVMKYESVLKSEIRELNSQRMRDGDTETENDTSSLQFVISTPKRSTKMRSPAMRYNPRSPSFAVKRRRMVHVMPSLGVSSSVWGN